jgi:hypothetical protein
MEADENEPLHERLHLPGAMLRPSNIRFPDGGRGIHLRLAIESATAHATPIKAKFMALAAQLKWL